MNLIRKAFVATACAVLTVALGPATARAEPAGVRTTDVSFRTADGITLGGTVFAPRGASGKLPGLLLVHGSGTGGPGYREHLRGEAEAFAEQGMVVLAPDKREKDYTRFHRDFGQLADDALRAFAVLRARPEVDPAKAGMWGLSEGGWVVPIAAERSADVKFVVLAAGSAMSPVRQQAWNVTNKMAVSGINGSITRSFPVTWHRMISDAGMFGGAFHDPIPVLHGVRQPVLGLWGERDTAIPPAETAELVAATLGASGNHHYVLRFVPNAEHAMHQRGPDGERLPTLMPGYADTVGTWVRAVTAGQVPAEHVDPLPAQDRTSVEVSRPAWWESAPVQFGAIGVFLVMFGAYPLVAMVRRFRGRGVPGTWSARVLAGAGLVVPLGMTGYLSVLMFTMTEYRVQAGPLLGNRPIIWLVLQALAVAATVATLLLARGWRSTTDRVRHRLLLAGGALFIPWALYWGLLLP
ncbi:prolyl oligopeptidase family serine peptidase [Actinophytocola sp.]|uniref:alpha/beta hydrolase family protein n=1 Tax=Actinophytocola sp. TaxID=1872138 RepID=UPI0025C5DDBA|nr:prolyl oligopeptidase family serine peptidase [Actinophytocola sp.]